MAAAVALSGIAWTGVAAQAAVQTRSVKAPFLRTYLSADSLLAAREGFGRNTTGGYAGNVVHVTTAADSGPGSLRAAVAGNTPAWVVFDGDYTIHFASGMLVGSNKTIDGRGHHVTLTGHGVFGLQIKNATNVIVENLILTDFGDVTKTAQNDKPDAIDVIASQNVWIDHCDLSMTGNKLIFIDKGSTGVTVSWSHFHDQQQTFQIGDQANAASDAAQTVTVDHNYFDHTAYRNPVLSYGKAHVYNNYVVGWSVWGVTSQRVGQMYLESNIFQSTGNTRAALTRPSQDGCNDDNTLCDDRPGYLNAVGNLTEGGAVLQTNQPSAVFRPSSYYPYTAQAATTSLAGTILTNAGWRALVTLRAQPGQVHLPAPAAWVARLDSAARLAAARFGLAGPRRS
jgi:pectate lyase